MTYTFVENRSKKILWVILEGEGYIDAIKALIFRARIKASQLKFRLLYDFSNFINKVEVSEIYNLYRSDLLSRLTQADPDSLKIDVAIIGNTEDAQLWEFTETTFYNAGICIRIFYTKDSAISWLNDTKKAICY